MAYQWRIIMFPWDVNPMNIMNWDLVLCWHFKVRGEHPCKCSALGCNSRNRLWNQHEPTQNWKWERDWEENAAAMEPIVFERPIVASLWINFPLGISAFVASSVVQNCKQRGVQRCRSQGTCVFVLPSWANTVEENNTRRIAARTRTRTNNNV